MSAAAPAIDPAALRGAEELPAPVSGQRHEIGSTVGRLTYYSAGPERPGKFPPLLDASLPKRGEPLRDWQAVVVGGGAVNGISLEGGWPARRVA